MTILNMGIIVSSLFFAFAIGCGQKAGTDLPVAKDLAESTNGFIGNWRGEYTDIDEMIAAQIEATEKKGGVEISQSDIDFLKSMAMLVTFRLELNADSTGILVDGNGDKQACKWRMDGTSAIVDAYEGNEIQNTITLTIIDRFTVKGEQSDGSKFLFKQNEN